MSKDLEVGSVVLYTNPVKDVDHCVLTCVIDAATKHYRTTQAPHLVVGQTVRVYYVNSDAAARQTRSRGKPKVYDCKLVEQVGENWKVRWTTDRHSEELFHPIDDSWEPVK